MRIFNHIFFPASTENIYMACLFLTPCLHCNFLYYFCIRQNLVNMICFFRAAFDTLEYKVKASKSSDFKISRHLLYKKQRISDCSKDVPNPHLPGTAPRRSLRPCHRHRQQSWVLPPCPLWGAAGCHVASPQPPVKERGSSVQSLFPHLHTTENAYDSRNTAKVTAGPLIFSVWIVAVNFLSLRLHSCGSGSPSQRSLVNARAGAMRRPDPFPSAPLQPHSPGRALPLGHRGHFGAPLRAQGRAGAAGGSAAGPRRS